MLPSVSPYSMVGKLFDVFALIFLLKTRIFGYFGLIFFAFDDFEIFKHIHTFVKAWMSLKLCAGECDVIGGFLPFYFEKKQ